MYVCVCVCGGVLRGLGRASLSLVNVGVSGPVPCVSPLFGGHLPLSVPVAVVVVVVVVTCWSVVLVTARLVALVVVLLALLGAVVPWAMAPGLVRTCAVVMVEIGRAHV